MLEASCLRIYLTESHKIDGKPAMETILELCIEAGLHGVSVMRGVEGIGQHGLHSAAFLSLSSNLPLVIEAIDSTENIEAALLKMTPHLDSCTVATWPVHIRLGNINTIAEHIGDNLGHD